ncbi:MAG: transposase [Flavobacteriales bacterium]|nr:transposase [Flavobacteriales bacterium]
MGQAGGLLGYAPTGGCRGEGPRAPAGERCPTRRRGHRPTACAPRRGQALLGGPRGPLSPQGERPHLRFVTNNTKWSPTTVARIYRQRWDIEMLFKRIKQNYPLRDFLGDSPNAIKIQIWCAFIADLLVTIVRDRAHLTGPRRWSFSGVASLRGSTCTPTSMCSGSCADPDRALIDYKPPEPSPQLSLQLSL